MKKLIIFAVALSAVLLLLFYCTDYNFDNPLDKKGTNYLFGDTTGEEGKIRDANDNGISDLFDPKYIVRFNANGGGGSLPPAQTVLKDLSINLPSGEGLSRTGYTFDRWCTTPSGMGTYYDAGSVFTPSLSMSFYARWKLKLYTVAFNANADDGTVSPTSDTTGEGWKLTTLPTPTRSGYTFKGWWTTETTGGDNVTVDWVYNADTTIYARWEEGVTQTTKYKLIVSANPPAGGTVSPAGERECEAGESVTVTATENSGYTFKGWTATGMDTPTGATITIVMTSNVTLTANFEDNDTPPEVVVGTLTDSRDGKTYKTVTIGGQTWMAENLNYAAYGGTYGNKCYGNNESNCTQYGRLYIWSTAMVACPVGWHLPSDEEWTKLTDDVGGASTAGTKLKSKDGWNSYSGVPFGTNEYGFSALPGGYGNSGGNFYNAGDVGSWWSATGGAWYRLMYYDYEVVGRYYNYETYLFSVRCVANQ